MPLLSFNIFAKNGKYYKNKIKNLIMFKIISEFNYVIYYVYLIIILFMLHDISKKMWFLSTISFIESNGHCLI